MPQRPDGKAAKTERVTFTKPAAERIAKVVRTVESGNRDSAPLRLGRSVPGHTPKQVRAATFTGSWAIGSSKTVTFKYAPTATASITNLTIASPVAGDCIVGKEGTSLWLVSSVQGHQRLCKTSATFNKGTVATLNVWESGTPPNETQTAGQTVPDVINKYANIASGKWVSVALHGNGRWYVIAAECS